MLSDDARERLKHRLNEVHDWPSVYMYKFVLEPDQHRIDAILAYFPAESEVLRRYSSGGKYLSVTIREVMMCAEDIVERYERVGTIPGVLAL